MALRARWILPAAISVALVAVPPLAASQAASPVIELLLNARDARTRVQAATTLGRLRPPGARQALESALGDGNAAVRASAAAALMTLGDPAALGALRAHADDRDPGVRAGIARALENLAPASGTSASASASASVAAANMGGLPDVDWHHVRYVLRLGSLANRAGGRAASVDVLRNAIVQEVSHTGDIALAMGVMPPEAERRMRAGRVRAYAIEGAINTLRRWTVATTMSVRAEVSLVLLADQSHAIVGSLSGAATAQQHTPYYDAETFAQQLEDRALSAAVRGALGNLEQSLSAAR